MPAKAISCLPHGACIIIIFVVAFAYLNKFATGYIYIFQIAQNISFPILLCLKAEESTCISKQLIGIYTSKIVME